MKNLTAEVETTARIPEGHQLRAEIANAVVRVSTWLTALVKALTDNPDLANVSIVWGTGVIIFEARAASTDIGKIIGKDGETAKSIRRILNAVGMKLKVRFSFEIIE
jgi:uncharacterized protein